MKDSNIKVKINAELPEKELLLEANKIINNGKKRALEEAREISKKLISHIKVLEKTLDSENEDIQVNGCLNLKILHFFLTLEIGASAWMKSLLARLDEEMGLKKEMH